jgi:hypothetical protein
MPVGFAFLVVASVLRGLSHMPQLRLVTELVHSVGPFVARAGKIRRHDPPRALALADLWQTRTPNLGVDFGGRGGHPGSAAEVQVNSDDQCFRVIGMRLYRFFIAKTGFSRPKKGSAYSRSRLIAFEQPWPTSRRCA